MATDTHVSHPKPMSSLRMSTNAEGQVEVTLRGNGGHFLLSANAEGPYVVMLSDRAGYGGMETVGVFYLKADGTFRGSWHETDPENPRKQYITSFPILKHIPIIDRLRELKPTAKKRRRKKA
jgi:hypothetical protein